MCILVLYKYHHSKKNFIFGSQPSWILLILFSCQMLRIRYIFPTLKLNGIPEIDASEGIPNKNLGNLAKKNKLKRLQTGKIRY